MIRDKLGRFIGSILDNNEILRRKKISDTFKRKNIKPFTSPNWKPSCGMKGKIPWNKGKTFSEEFKQKLRKAKIGYKPTFGGKHYNGHKTINQEMREKIRKKLMGHVVSLKTRDKIREKRKGQVFPRSFTKTERKFLKICKDYSLPYKYVGNGKFWIENINPDFINCNGEKIAIEINGCYWHECKICGFKRNKQIRESYKTEYRENLLKKYGWKIITIWEHEIKEGNERNIILKIEKEV